MEGAECVGSVVVDSSRRSNVATKSERRIVCGIDKMTSGRKHSYLGVNVIINVVKPFGAGHDSQRWWRGQRVAGRRCLDRPLDPSIVVT